MGARRGFAVAALTVSLLASSVGFSAPPRHAERVHAGAVYMEHVKAHDRRPLAEVMKVPKGSIQVFASDGRQIEVPVPPGVQPEAVALCPGDSLLAISGRTGPPDPADVVIVATLQGLERARFSGATGFQWSHEAPRLVVEKTQLPDDAEVPNMYGTELWDARTGITRTSTAPTYQTGWVGADTVILFDASTFRDLEWSTGQVSASRYHGTLISPDRRFSLHISYEGSQILWDARQGRDIAAPTLKVAGTPWFTGNLDLPPFWLSSSPHDLCIPISGLPRTANDPDSTSGARIAVVDVVPMKLKAIVPGKFLAPTSDYNAALVSIGDGVRVLEIRP